MIKYTFKDDFLPFKNADQADAQAIGEALAEQARDAGGPLDTEAVLHAATDPKHPIHPHLEWDDTVAAHRYRLDQVRAIIRCIRQTDDENHEPVHSFLSVSDKGGIAYRGVREVQTSATLRLQVLKQAERDLEAWERRYKDLSDICTIVASARARVRKRIDVASRTTP